MLRQMGFNRLIQVPERSAQIINLVVRSFSHCDTSSEPKDKIERIVKIINEHPFPDQPLQPTLLQHAPPQILTTHFVENVLGCLVSAHSNGLKALEFFKFSLRHSPSGPTTESLEKMLHILVRMKYFDRAWDLMRKTKAKHPSLLTLKSMSVVMEKVAKYHSYEETLDAFERMEKEIFPGQVFGTEEFNVLLRAFCSNRLMREARHAFVTMHSQFGADKKTMHILLWGFKDVRDIDAIELFYDQMISRGFEPDEITYSFRIDGYCKARRLRDALRLLEEMEHEKNMSPTLGTLTTLIHGAGLVKDSTKARELFKGIESRGLVPDTAAYNSYMSSLVQCGDLKSVPTLMDEMDEKKVSHDNMTYHNAFSAMMTKRDFEGVKCLYEKMVERGFIPQVGTVITLMRFFCENKGVGRGLQLWNYIVEKGHCPHPHTAELLFKGLCSQNSVQEAFGCSKQVLERGRNLTDSAFLMVEKLLLSHGENEKLKELKKMAVKLRTHSPVSRAVPVI